VPGCQMIEGPKHSQDITAPEAFTDCMTELKARRIWGVASVLLL
jgi:hypothetical protein